MIKISTQATWIPLLLAISLTACDGMNPESLLPAGSHGETTAAHPEHAAEIEPEKGPHHGRLLRDGNFILELAIFETGVPPEFRAWATKDGKALNPETVDLSIRLTRLGGKTDEIKFKPQGDALRGDTVIYEPHSFIVTVNALHNGSTHTWQYDNFEGRTKIETAVAEALDIETSIAGPVVMQKTISVYGQITANEERIRKISARFDGVIKSVFPSLGDRVRKGQKLATVESNESLQLFTISAPIGGVITQRSANAGEQTDGRQLFTIMDTSSVWAELSVFPADLAQVQMGALVTITDTSGKQTVSGKISRMDVTTQDNQAVKVHVVLDNKEGQLHPGRYVNAKITVGEHPAALAVKRSGLQAFRDFTVVYAQIGEEYEVRMLDLGLQAGEWAEVLGGLEPGTHYVSKNSYVIKADIEKSGAAHDH
ncbi:MAG TPA: HlyD family efflux transporter periplasmic adaptor subunit [Gammaproteobacteria bacterium]|nr:HlyD family efflux transporter periplasmic adaptor subunit [Gammaproteobacteria bacterium]